jgi:predicted ATP-binding protein involved in virulence
VKIDSKIRLQSIEIRNYKALDHIKIDFSEPIMSDDPDVFLIGSKNGIGKTSILESICLLFIGLIVEKENLKNFYFNKSINIPDIIISSGEEEASVEGEFIVEGELFRCNVSINRDGYISSKFFNSNIKLSKKIIKNKYLKKFTEEDIIEQFFLTFSGLNREPFIFEPLIYFNSYRKVQEGSLEFGSVFRDKYKRSKGNNRDPISSFKIEVLSLMMNKSGLFEDSSSKKAEFVLEKLNDLIITYAGGYIDKLKPSEDNTIDFRITPINPNKKSFSFDGLSSGQKEIISTLFLIWFYTYEKSRIILIDEPELHLNSEWHRSFINSLFKIAPNNQYIISTHSEEIFASVKKDRRLLLIPDED